METLSAAAVGSQTVALLLRKLREGCTTDIRRQGKILSLSVSLSLALTHSDLTKFGNSGQWGAEREQTESGSRYNAVA